MKVYKLCGESYEITESPEVYATRELALAAAKDFEDFLGMGVEEALECGEIEVLVWDLVGTVDEQ